MDLIEVAFKANDTYKSVNDSIILKFYVYCLLIIIYLTDVGIATSGNIFTIQISVQYF